MTQSSIAATAQQVETAHSSNWCKQDTVWMLGLYGTAVGAGTLFLPIDAGVGGVWPLLVMALIAFPMTFFAHRAFCRFVLSGSGHNGDITVVMEEHFGNIASKLITLLYFFAIYPALLMYSVAMTNTVQAFIVHQLAWTPPPRALLSLAIVLSLMAVVRCGEQAIVRTMSVLVFPFIGALMFLAVYLSSNWNLAIVTHASSFSDSVSSGQFIKTLWLAIPVIVYSFNHAPIISSFAVANKQQYGEYADKKCSLIMVFSHAMMVMTVMFFVFSCVFSLSLADLTAAKEQNVSILSYLANKFNDPLIDVLAPLIAVIAIGKSFLGHYLGAREGFNGLLIRALRGHGKTVKLSILNRITAIFIIITAWGVATINPSILGMIEILGGPVTAFLLFLMPMYAIHKVPALRQFAGKLSNLFTTVVGVIALLAIFYSLRFTLS